MKQELRQLYKEIIVLNQENTLETRGQDLDLS